MKERGLPMKLSLLTLVVVAIIAFLATATLFFVLRARDKNLCLSKFATWVRRPTLILFGFTFLGALVDDWLDTFFLTWPPISSLVLFSFACFVGTIPVWIAIVILYIIKINKEPIPTANDDPTPTATEQEATHQNDQKKIRLRLILTLTKQKWISLSKNQKRATIGSILSTLTYIPGAIIQIRNYESNNGERSIIATVLLIASITIFVFTRFKRKTETPKTQD